MTFLRIVWGVVGLTLTLVAALGAGMPFLLLTKWAMRLDTLAALPLQGIGMLCTLVVPAAVLHALFHDDDLWMVIWRIFNGPKK